MDSHRGELWRVLQPRRGANAATSTHAATVDHYQSILRKATKVLDDMLQDPQPNNRFRAAQTILCMANSFRTDSESIRERVPEPDVPPEMA